MKLSKLFLETEDLVSPGLSACPGCAAELALRTVMRVLGPDTILGIPPGCMAGAGAVGWNRLSGVKVPVTIPLLDNTASLLSGVRRQYLRQGRDNVKVVAFAGDGATADAGFQALSGAAERGENIIYICYDNEGYMNTGFQRSGTTAKGSETSTTPVGRLSQGKAQNKKDMPLLLAFHDAAYVATISPAYTQDFVRKVEKATTVRAGLAYLHIFSPCPTGWHFPPEDTIAIARLAVQTNFFPLWEYEKGRFRQTLAVKQPKPLKEFVRHLGKYRHLEETQIADLQAWVDQRTALLDRLFAGEGAPAQ
ncbi:MAG TPA: NADH-dependent phenylglyoxylate [Firmicutes bacterium]|nr:NADH-dependent phenylglyoxylate [Bacillota bacterium]